MDRRSLIAVGVCFVILLFYPYFLKWVSPPASVPVSMPAIQNTESFAQSSIPAPSTPKEGQLLPKYETSEEEFVVENDQVRVVLSSWGGDIKAVGLKYFHDKRGEPIRLGPGDKEGWKTLSFLRLVAGGSWNTEGSYKGSIEGKKVVFESIEKVPYSIKKTYVFAEKGYEIQASVELISQSTERIVLEGAGITVGSILGHEEKEGSAEISAAALDNLGNMWRKNLGKVKDKQDERGSYQWVGLQNSYYAIILKPAAEAQGLIVAPVFGAASKAEGLCAAATMGTFAILPGGVFKQDYLVYAGPKEYFQMEKLPNQFQKIIDFGWFAPIAKAILYLLDVFFKMFHNYGIAIIVLTILVKVITYPLTAVSFKSMKRMQTIQPHVNALKERLKDNPKKMQKEMMELYKEHKVNPMGGCLPMLIQLPIFVALFNALRNAVELKGASFLWMHDLSMPDTVAVVAGLPINILPIIMGGTMFWQQKMSTVDPAQAKMMMFMPIIFTFIFYSFPSGLVLYWLVNNVLSIAQQYQVQRQKV